MERKATALTVQIVPNEYTGAASYYLVRRKAGKMMTEAH